MKLWELCADRLLNDTDLFENALQRKEGLKNIADLSFRLAEHMVLLEHCPEATCRKHWKDEVDAWLDRMYEQTRIKKKAQIARGGLVEAIWEGPLGEYEDYLARYKAAKRKEEKERKHSEPELKFTEPNDEAWRRIRTKLMKAIDMMLLGKTPEYDTL